MDYFQGVVTEYLRAKRSRFVNTEYMINLDADGSYKKDRHWFCDALTIDFADSTVYLCEITYAKSLNAVTARLQSWATNWGEVVASIRRDSSLRGDWIFVPRVFIPLELQGTLTPKLGGLKRPELPSLQMPQPLITPLEKVLPWKYRSWNGQAYAAESDD